MKIAHVRECDVRATVEYMENANELFNIMNSKEVICWTETDDGVSYRV